MLLSVEVPRTLAARARAAVTTRFDRPPSHATDITAAPRPTPDRSFLATTDAWKDRYYVAGTAKFLERRYFAGPTANTDVSQADTAT
jgi:hypothetical protein